MPKSVSQWSPMRIWRPICSSITASTIGCSCFRRVRSAVVATHRSSHPSDLAAPGLVVQGWPDGEVGLAPSGVRIGPVRAGSGFGGGDGHRTSPIGCLRSRT